MHKEDFFEVLNCCYQHVFQCLAGAVDLKYKKGKIADTIILINTGMWCVCVCSTSFCDAFLTKGLSIPFLK